MATPNFIPELTLRDRMEVARRFLAMGNQELSAARATSDSHREQEAAEKIFHALEEACTARVQKYGIDIPHDHSAIKAGLTTAGEVGLAKAYQSAYLLLHVAAYYRGWLDKKAIDGEVAKVERAIADVDRKLKR